MNITKIQSESLALRIKDMQLSATRLIENTKCAETFYKLEEVMRCVTKALDMLHDEEELQDDVENGDFNEETIEKTFPEPLRRTSVVFDETNITLFKSIFDISKVSPRIGLGAPFFGENCIKLVNCTRIDHLQTQPTYQKGQLLCADHKVSYSPTDSVAYFWDEIYSLANKDRIYKNSIILIHPHSIKFDMGKYFFRFGTSEDWEDTDMKSDFA